MTRAEELAEMEWVGELNKALNAKVAELVADAEALAEALEPFTTFPERFRLPPKLTADARAALARYRGEK